MLGVTFVFFLLFAALPISAICLLVVKPPQFTLRDLLLSVSLIAVGFTCITTPMRLDGDSKLAAWAILFAPFGPPLIGAGLMLPFGKALRGATWGGVLTLYVVVYAFFKT